MSKPGADNRKVFQGASHRYVVLKPLGSGGMGSTWVVFDHRMGDLKQFAIKILDPKLARSDPRAREHFVHEARATAALDHPNIVSVMWIDELSDGTPLYAMELLNGESVGTALKRGPIPVQEGLNIVLDVLDGLHFAHKHALVHQDIKPSNIVLHRNARGESVAKIIDFGVVRTADDGDRGFAGTFAYAAPEQIRGGKIGPATDIFGAGALLFEILTGSRPFAGYPSNLTGAVARLDARPPSILSFGRFTDELADLVSRALAPRAEDRPETAKAFGLELRKIARELASPTPKPEHISQVGRPILRGALADTTDQTGIEYEEIIARARRGSRTALGRGLRYSRCADVARRVGCSRRARVERCQRRYPSGAAEAARDRAAPTRACRGATDFADRDRPTFARARGGAQRAPDLYRSLDRRAGWFGARVGRTRWQPRSPDAHDERQRCRFRSAPERGRFERSCVGGGSTHDARRCSFFDHTHPAVAGRGRRCSRDREVAAAAAFFGTTSRRIIPTSSIHSAEPKHVSPPTDILRTQ